MSDTPTIEAYAEKLAQDKAELNSLYQDLLIGVTQFFRDEEPFRFLKSSVLPELIEKRAPDRTLRVLVSACATGEEAYSLAILFHEVFEELGRPVQLKLFATDVHKRSLNLAGRGIFGEESMKHVSQPRRQRYFTKQDNGFQIVNEIRELIVFAQHNVLRDAPFTDLDFVSCRNLLIYFQPSAQTKALSLLHFGLNTDGILFLGSSETPGEISSEFETLHERNKVYRKWRQVRLPAEIRMPAIRNPGLSLPVPAIRGFTSPTSTHDASLYRVFDYLLNRFMPPSLLINEKRELVHSFSGAEKLLSPPVRRPSLDLLDWIDPSLRTTIIGALQRVARHETQIRFSGVRIASAEGETIFDLIVEPFRHPSTNALHFLLMFESMGPAVEIVPALESSTLAAGEVSMSQIRQLEDELRYAKENLQATVEELETSNEELQATNEELVASNEELQSTNEELHSVNEELYSVNAEYQRKIGELAEVNQDLHHLLENTDVATIFLDSELKIRKFTSRVREIFDLIDEDIGRPIASFAHRIQLNDLLDRIKQVRELGESCELEVHTVNGCCYLLRILPHRLNQRIGGVVIVLVDLAPIEDLRGRLRWMSAIVESTDDAIIGENLEGIVTSWNAGAQSLYGYTAEEAIGRHVSFLIPVERRGEVSDYLSHIQRGESVRTIETVRLRRDDSPVHVSLTISAVRDAANRVIGVSKIARDVSQRFAAERALREQAQQREMFLAMLSHELRNPLNAVMAASRLLQQASLSTASQTRAITAIHRQSKMIAGLLDDLLDMSRISLGKIELTRTMINLVSLVEPIMETTQPQVESHQGELRFEILEEELYVYGDPARLIQVHVNLIHNATKYSPPGSPITITLRAESGWAVVEVLDQGAGIAADFLPHIFDPFVQSDETLDRAAGGLGVGLTLVKSLVELHEGTIEAFSEGRNKGSKFVVKLPLVAADSVAHHVHQSTTQAELRLSARHASGVAEHSFHRTLRVVVIEDIEDNREMLADMLRLEGHDVITAADGESGWQEVLKSCPDIALVDIGLPGMDGYEVAKRLRSCTSMDSLYLVALTGYGQATDVAQAKAAGFDAHMVKPVDADELDALLRSVASKRAMLEP